MEASPEVGSRLRLLQETAGVPEVLAAHNMRRLLDAYRTLAPLTIGGPASTTLEASPGPRQDQGRSRAQQFPWFLGHGPARRRHSSCSGGTNGPPPPPPQHPPLSPTHPILSPRDRDSSRLHSPSTVYKDSCYTVNLSGMQYIQ